MTSNQALDMLFQTFQLSVQIALPLLLISMIVGIIMAIITAATSINEQTLTFVPKLLSILRSSPSSAARSLQESRISCTLCST